MTTLQLSLGAINKITGEYTYHKLANKKDTYICPDCNKDLILCQGNIRAHYFRHKIDTINPCHYYTKPTETQIHKDAKLLIKMLLEKKIPISFIKVCKSCKKNNEIKIPEIKETSNIHIEYRFEYNGLKIADVAYVDNGKILYIFEICNTHKTSCENRPEPWFEIDALSLINKVNEKLTSLQIQCIRSDNCVECVECINKNKTTLLQIKDDLKSKCSSDTSDNYCCFSDEILEMFIQIICEGDCKDLWLNTFSCMDDTDIIIYHNNNTCNDVIYDLKLINDIYNLKLNNYIINLEIYHGRCEIIIKNNKNINLIKILLIKCLTTIFGCDENEITINIT